MSLSNSIDRLIIGAQPKQVNGTDALQFQLVFRLDLFDSLFYFVRADIEGEVDEIVFKAQYTDGNYSSTRSFTDKDGSDGWEREYTWRNDISNGTFTVWAEAMKNGRGVGSSPKIEITLYYP